MKLPKLQDLLSEIDLALRHLNCTGEASLSLIQDMRLAISEEEAHNVSASKRLLDSNSLMLEVDALIEKQYLRVAEMILKGALAVNVSPTQCVRKLAEIYELESCYEKTIEIAGLLLVKHPGELEIIYQLSFALYKLGRTDEALEYMLPLVIQEPVSKVFRLCGLILQGLGNTIDAIEMLTKAIECNKNDNFSIKVLSQLYVQVGMNEKALEVLWSIPDDLVEEDDRLSESLIYRFMGDLDRAISLNQCLIEKHPDYTNAYWTQCFNYSISSANRSSDLLDATSRFWDLTSISEDPCDSSVPLLLPSIRSKIRIGFLSADIGEHVVSRFLMPILRHYDRNRFSIVIIITARRYEQRADDIACYADEVVTLYGIDTPRSVQHLKSLSLDVIIDTNGFTTNSQLPLLASRCAPIQCHYIGYHATTGLRTIDYFLGDALTTPEEFQSQFIEKLVRIPMLWMAYDSCLEFPIAATTVQRESPVLGSFSQVTKINSLTLQYWAKAMKACPDSILVIKDRGVHCQKTCRRIENALEEHGVDPQRIYMFGPVGSQEEHLGCYNAIDIALDTTPWSGATTAFEALGMGVPLVAICGDSTSGRMSTSVVSAAGMSYLVTHSVNEFASCVAALAINYKEIRHDKARMQKEVRSGILFDEERITRDFFSTMQRLVVDTLPII